MKRIILALFAITMIAVQAVAEPKEPTADMLKELQEFKIKYLIQEMELPTEKQAEFTKLYSQYENERASLFRELHQRNKSIRKNSSPTDTEYQVAAESMANARYREGELETKYFNKFKTMLSPKQLYLLKRSEQKFERKLGEMKHKQNKKTKK